MSLFTRPFEHRVPLTCYAGSNGLGAGCVTCVVRQARVWVPSIAFGTGTRIIALSQPHLERQNYLIYSSIEHVAPHHRQHRHGRPRPGKRRPLSAARSLCSRTSSFTGPFAPSRPRTPMRMPCLGKQANNYRKPGPFRNRTRPARAGLALLVALVAVLPRAVASGGQPEPGDGAWQCHFHPCIACRHAVGR